MNISIDGMPEFDDDLKQILRKLAKNASFKEYCEAVDKWEITTIQKYKESEWKAQSGKLKPHF